MTVANLAAGNEKIIRKVSTHGDIKQSVLAHIAIPGHVYYRTNDCNWTSFSRSTIPDFKEEWCITKEAPWVLLNVTNSSNNDTIW